MQNLHVHVHGSAFAMLNRPSSGHAGARSRCVLSYWQAQQHVKPSRLNGGRWLPGRVLHTLFMTRIKLDSPASGAAASAHNQQIALDAEALLSEQNYAQLTSLCPEACVPLRSCGTVCSKLAQRYCSCIIPSRKKLHRHPVGTCALRKASHASCQRGLEASNNQLAPD